VWDCGTCPTPGAVRIPYVMIILVVLSVFLLGVRLARAGRPYLTVGLGPTVPQFRSVIISINEGVRMSNSDNINIEIQTATIFRG
jgi:RNase adaptor protein for sRNA GlmZ degradation